MKFRNLKGVLALVLAIMVFASMAVPAMAAGEPYKITVSNSNSHITMVGKTYSAYKLFDVTYPADATTTTGVDTNVPHSYSISTSSPFYATAPKALLDEYFTFTPSAADATTMIVTPIKVNDSEGRAPGATGYVDTYKFNETTARTLADDLKQYLPASADGTSAAATTQSVDIPLTQAGYYLVYGTADNTANGDPKEVVAALALTTTDPNGAVVVKADAPEIKKEINGSSDTDTDTTGMVTSNRVNIGDDVPYVVTSRVPDMTGYDNYWFIVKDKMSKGLTFKNDVAISIDGTDLDNDDFEVTTTKEPNGATNIKIVFDNFIQYKGKKDAEIIITYKGTLNKDAVVGDVGNPNTVSLVYSNSPYKDYSGTPSDDKTGNLVNETPESTVITYTTGIKVLKINGTQEPLADATFTLTGPLNKVEKTTTATVFEEDDAGTYWKLKDGTYTTVDPSTFDGYTNKTELLAKYESTEQKYKKNTVEETATVAAGASDGTVTATTTSEGIINFEGLTHGQYTLQETAAPAGYNKLAYDIVFTVGWDATNTKWTVTDNSDLYNVSLKSDGTFEVTVINETGVELPSTGGIGTTIFYVAGSLMVLAAAILLITKRRMGAED